MNNRFTFLLICPFEFITPGQALSLVFSTGRMLTCPCDVATPSPWPFQFFFSYMHILYIHYILLSCRDKEHTGYKDVAMLDAAFATEMALTILYDFCTCNWQFRAYPNSPPQEVSSLEPQAHQLSSYSDSKMSCTGLDICCQSNFHFRDPM